VASAAAVLVFAVWYPHPFGKISGGRELFFLLISVDVVSGPLLTLCVFNLDKPRRVLWRDMAIVVALQLSALAYGLNAMHEARPVLLAFEGNRFRAVSAAEIDQTQLPKAPEGMQKLSHSGPQLIGARLSRSEDSDYLSSVQESLNGNPPALRPARWVPFSQQQSEVVATAKALAALRVAKANVALAIDAAVAEAKLPIEQLGYIPLQSRTNTDWIVIINRATGLPVTFAPVDGW
jgi:hypothetical protein